ncbi:MAG: hypothetical protein ABSD75_11005 [Terriglobales bacterium]|jgi:hypothetical protein
MGPNRYGGVPPSITALTFGTRHDTPLGILASGTALGQSGYGDGRRGFEPCCANPFSTTANPQRFPVRHPRRRGQKDHSYFPIGIAEPAYLPYAVPYLTAAADDATEDDEEAEVDGADAPRPTRPAMASRPARDGDFASNPGAAESITARPSAVLVFKDGHRSEVLNYAIVGDTLFDFGDGRTRKILLADLDLSATRKANDNRGVDFQVPAGGPSMRGAVATD